VQVSTCVLVRAELFSCQQMVGTPTLDYECSAYVKGFQPRKWIALNNQQQQMLSSFGKISDRNPEMQWTDDVAVHNAWLSSQITGWLWLTERQRCSGWPADVWVVLNSDSCNTTQVTAEELWNAVDSYHITHSKDLKMQCITPRALR
jgi:hypothetical protein